MPSSRPLQSRSQIQNPRREISTHQRRKRAKKRKRKSSPPNFMRTQLQPRKKVKRRKKVAPRVMVLDQPAQSRKFTILTQLTGRISPTTTLQASEPLSTIRKTLSGDKLPNSFN